MTNDELNLNAAMNAESIRSTELAVLSDALVAVEGACTADESFERLKAAKKAALALLAELQDALDYFPGQGA